METILRKANKSELRLRKLAQTALESIEKILGYSRWYHNTNHIAFNCKVHAYIDVDDVKDILRASKMTFTQLRNALTLFNNKRIENIYYHILEREADGFRDWIAGCSFTSRKAVHDNMERYPVDFPYTMERPALNRKRSVEAKKKFILDFFKDGFEALDKLALINDDDVHRIGRSAGHFAVAEANVFEGYKERLDFFLKQCFEGDNIVLDGSESTTHATWMDRVHGYYDCSLTDVENIIAHCDLIEFVIEEGKSLVRALDRQYFLNALLDEIHEEVGDFETMVDEERLQAWAKHQVTKFSTHAGSYSYLRLSKDSKKVETSQGISVSVDESKRLYQQLVKLDPDKLNQLDEKVSMFNTNVFGAVPGHQEPILVAGCHKFKWSFLQKFYTDNLDKLAA